MPMKKNSTLLIIFLFLSISSFAQTKVSGIVVDNTNEPVPFANIVFKGSNTGVVSNEDGRFYIESPDNYSVLSVAFVGFPTQDFKLPKKVIYDFKVVLKGGAS